MDIQEIIALIIVCCSLLFLVRHTMKGWRKAALPGCAGGCGCGKKLAKKSAKPQRM